MQNDVPYFAYRLSSLAESLIFLLVVPLPFLSNIIFFKRKESTYFKIHYMTSPWENRDQHHKDAITKPYMTKQEKKVFW